MQTHSMKYKKFASRIGYNFQDDLKKWEKTKMNQQDWQGLLLEDGDGLNGAKKI